VCPVDATIFGTPGNTTARRAGLTADEEAMLAALNNIADAVRPVITRKFGAVV
jgi:hypothetical protein